MPNFSPMMVQERVPSSKIGGNLMIRLQSGHLIEENKEKAASKPPNRLHQSSQLFKVRVKPKLLTPLMIQRDLILSSTCLRTTALYLITL